MSGRRGLKPLLAMLGTVAVLSLLVFRHFLLEITVSAAVAIFLAPIQKRLSRGLGERPAGAAALLTALAAFALLVPAAGAVTVLSRQALRLAEEARPYLQPVALEAFWRQSLPERVPMLREWIDFQGEPPPFLVTGAERALASLQSLVQLGIAGLGGAAYELSLFLLMLFFLLRDGPRLELELRAVSPLSDTRELEILDHLARTVKGVLLAMLIVPVVQGLVAFPGFVFFGVPQPAVWSLMVVLAAFVPLLGSPLGWVPAVVWLFLRGETWQWAGLLFFGMFGISMIDNLVKPMLLRGAAAIHPLLGFLSILGGVFSFGPLGVLVGPVILSLMLSALRIYRLDVLREAEASSPGSPPPSA